MVIFHSYVNVYQRVFSMGEWEKMDELRWRESGDKPWDFNGFDAQFLDKSKWFSLKPIDIMGFVIILDHCGWSTPQSHIWVCLKICSSTLHGCSSYSSYFQLQYIMGTIFRHSQVDLLDVCNFDLFDLFCMVNGFFCCLWMSETVRRTSVPQFSYCCPRTIRIRLSHIRFLSRNLALDGLDV